jgi:quinol monooxygenase YgiN
MFVLVVRLKLKKGQEKAFEAAFKKAHENVRKEEKNLLIYDIHRKVGEPSEIVIYERYKDKKDWEVTHRSKAYVKELLAQFPAFIEGEVKREEYELIES